jgi:hypothetical protein
VDPNDNNYQGRLAFEAYLKASDTLDVAPWPDQNHSAWTKAAKSVKLIERPEETEDTTEASESGQPDELHLDAAHADG